MLKVILVDDEEPALVHLERLLLADGRVQVAGKFTSAQEGLDYLAERPADIAFLDIGMPEMNGLEAAERMQTLDPSLRVVYVTAYSAYAVEAFELYALDYLLKPVDAERIRKTIDRIEQYAKLIGIQKREEPGQAEASGKLSVRCFRRLDLMSGADLAERVKWRTKKAQELFAYLVHLRGAWVTKERLMETLWREQEHDKAITYLHHSVSRIRWLLREWGMPFSVEYEQESYRLPCADIQTDIAEFERIVHDRPYRFADRWDHYEYALSLYQGDYLEEHNYEWAETRRLELQQRYFGLLCGMARHELEQGRERSAIGRLQRALAIFPYSDEICRLMMQGHAQLNNKAMLKECYELFRHMLSHELGVGPEPQTTELYGSLMDGDA